MIRGAAMVYLEAFTLPIDTEELLLYDRRRSNGGYIDNCYPCRLFSDKRLSEINFKTNTILYGGNGSGKSTLLNLIAKRLELNRIAPFNSSEMFDEYAECCECECGFDDEGFRHRIPNGSRIITSDDIFDYMLTVRTNNAEITEGKEKMKKDYATIKYGENVQFHGMEDYEALRLQLLARRKSVTRRQFIRKTVGDEVKLSSNGETALQYFHQKLKHDTLYCLDEPENSLSPKLQLKLVELLEDMSRNCGCQFIIATHSPFILAMENAKIYNLDSIPASTANWWELENTKIYYEFFKKHANYFKK